MESPNPHNLTLLPSPTIVPASSGRQEASPRTPRKDNERRRKLSSESLNRDIERPTAGGLLPSPDIFPSGPAREEAEAHTVPKGTKRRIEPPPGAPTSFKHRYAEDLNSSQDNTHAATRSSKQRHPLPHTVSSPSLASLTASLSNLSDETQPHQTPTKGSSIRLSSQKFQYATPDREVRVPVSPAPVTYSLVSYNLGPGVTDSSPRNAPRVLPK
ncbi:hypothetical protein QBC41DRAFT_299120 [Cercophora samala]|uniref:Uncharacterized protein n=1 Tax=Cercophora samala TaxID=330535 RepID=A0AA39ZLG5_9PEZI|nr:hypothetical protein QBC41DRAFT_299120 [Cercophora samala]